MDDDLNVNNDSSGYYDSVNNDSSGYIEQSDNMVDYVADRIADESEIRRGNSSRTGTLLRT
jgi:hypothetical protein